MLVLVNNVVCARVLYERTHSILCSIGWIVFVSILCTMQFHKVLQKRCYRPIIVEILSLLHDLCVSHSVPAVYCLQAYSVYMVVLSRRVWLHTYLRQSESVCLCVPQLGCPCLPQSVSLLVSPSTSACIWACRPCRPGVCRARGHMMQSKQNIRHHGV